MRDHVTIGSGADVNLLVGKLVKTLPRSTTGARTIVTATLTVTCTRQPSYTLEDISSLLCEPKVVDTEAYRYFYRVLINGSYRCLGPATAAKGFSRPLSQLSR